MSPTNIFSSQKKKPLVSQMSQAPQMSYASVMPRSTPQPSRSAAPNMSMAPRPTRSAAPNMSMAPRQIQGSGMTGRYASNPSNYKPVTSVTPPPVVPPPPSIPAPPSASQARMNDVIAASDRQKAFAQKAITDQTNATRERYALANQQLGSAIEPAKQQFGQFKANAEASIADLLAGGERQKSQASDYYGDAQRGAAQALRETQGQNSRTFANLNTLDSRGEGSFGQANENTMSDFNRTTNQLLRAKADKLSEIDATVNAAERSARSTITQEESKMNELVQKINFAQAYNRLDEAAALTEAYNQSQQYIYDIEDSLAQTKYQFALEGEKLQTEIAKQNSSNFSPEFMNGGQPTNQAEYEFFVKNKEAINSLNGGGESLKPKAAAQLQIEGKAGAGLRALQTIKTQIQNNPNIIVQASIPGSPGAREYEAAISSITDAIGGLRTGASVSPDQQKFYKNLLPKIGDSPSTIAYKINAVKQELTSYSQGSATSDTMSGGGQTITAPDGQQIILTD